jgi:hypothetical protein
VSSRLKLLAKSRRKQGITRLHLALMPCLENNPVLAAYGAVRSGSAQAMEGAGGQGAAGTSGRVGIGSGAPGVALAAVQEGEEEGGGMRGGSSSSRHIANGGAAPAAGGGAALAPQQQQMAADAAPTEAEAPPGLQLPAAPSMTRTAAHVEAAARLAQYLQSQQRPNRYGYLPIAQEWDIWCACVAQLPVTLCLQHYTQLSAAP